jgi:hypothetical protein
MSLIALELDSIKLDSVSIRKLNKSFVNRVIHLYIK